MVTITDHVLRTELEKITQTNVNNINAIGGIVGTVLIREKKVIKVRNNILICDDNSEVKLYSPIPCIYWKCINENIEADGTITLQKPINVLTLQTGDNIFAIGVEGYSDEFEIRCTIGESEIRMSKEYINLKSPHIIKNGVELE